MTGGTSFPAYLTPDPEKCRVLWSAEVQATPTESDGSTTSYLARLSGPSGTFRDYLLLQVLYTPTWPPVVVECDEGKIFSPNAPYCPLTCSGNVCFVEGSGPGCVCRRGTIGRGNECVPFDLCPNLTPFCSYVHV